MAAPCRVLGEKWLLKGPWTSGAQGAGKSPVASLCCVRREHQTWQVGFRFLYGSVPTAGSHSAAPGTCLYFGGVSLISWPWPQRNTACFVVLLLHPRNPLQTAPERRDGLICCLLILGLSAILQINLWGKSIFLTLSTLIYTTFLMIAPVTNAKGLLKTCLNANVFHVQNTVVWGGGEYMVLNKLARGSSGLCRAGFCATACVCMF